MKNRKYEDRLKIWEITSLTERRKRGDLIQTYKIKSNLESINWFTGPIQAPLTQTRSATNNEQRLMRELFPSKTRNDFCHHVSVRHEFYLNRVVEDWNGLSNSIIQTPTLNSYKVRLDDYYKKLVG